MTQPIAVIPHPNKLGTSVTVRKLTRTENMAVSDEISRMRRPVAIEQKGGGWIPNPKAGGQPYHIMVADGSTLDLVSAHTRKAMVGWVNVTDVEGNVLPFKPENVKVLWDDHLDVKLTCCIRCDSQKDAQQHQPVDENDEAWHAYIEESSFGAYIEFKVQDVKTFDPDPSTNVSASPST